MAEEAHKEPTMEEILASIRKIISEDDDTKATGAEANALRPEEIPTDEVEDEDEGLSLDALASETRDDEDMFEEFDLSDLETEAPVEAVEETPAEPVVAEAEDSTLDEAFSDFEDETLDIEGAIDSVDAAPEPEFEVSAPEPEPAFEAADTFEADPEPEIEAAPVVAEPIAPSPEAPAEQTMQALTEESTETAAAGALAKLVAKMDMGSENTLEGLVRELVKPMIKEWLDANLPAIVEDKVEAEVQRIARLAR
ncbi:MAG: DUF2497 domain-containing protein [Pseudomonadota bacterium]